jgi:hypothetical protein
VHRTQGRRAHRCPTAHTHHTIVWSGRRKYFLLYTQCVSSWPANAIDWLQPTSCPNLADSCTDKCNSGDCCVPTDVELSTETTYSTNVPKGAGREGQLVHTQLLWGFLSYPLAICDILQPKMPKRKPVLSPFTRALFIYYEKVCLCILFFSSFKYLTTNVYRMGSIMMSWVF